MTPVSLAATYCDAAERMVGNVQPRVADTNIADMDVAELRTYLLAAITEAAVTRVALALACGDVLTIASRVSRGFARRQIGHNPPIQAGQKSAITLSSEER